MATSYRYLRRHRANAYSRLSRFKVGNEYWHYFSRDKIDYLFRKSDSSVFRMEKNELIHVADFKGSMTPNDLPWFMTTQYLETLVHIYNGSVITTDQWKYSILLTPSSALLKTGRSKRHKPDITDDGLFVLSSVPLRGYHYVHRLEYNGETILMPFYKTRLLTKELIEQYIENYCLDPNMFGYQNICVSMFKKIKVLKKLIDVNCREDLIASAALYKLTK